jgi:hypothetical protein
MAQKQTSGPGWASSFTALFNIPDRPKSERKKGKMGRQGRRAAFMVELQAVGFLMFHPN